MRRRRFLGMVGAGLPLAVSVTGCRALGGGRTTGGRRGVRPGVEVFLASETWRVKGKRLGLITNPTGVDAQLSSIVERFRRHRDLKLVALYGPEHGVRGNAQAGEYVPFYFDAQLKLPVFSLYGQSMKPPPGMLKDIDAYMRSFDTEHHGKAPEQGMLEAVDVMLFDLQDVGTRVYTYVATMAYAMQSCAESGIPFVVLDRPNPINGLDLEGPMLDYPRLSSFVGLYPIPLRHGMTAGELARFFNERFLKPKVELTVVPMEGWRRRQWFDETGLPWVIPSPNLPTLDTATVYPGQVLLEGTNLSEGRGTTRPFEIFGAPWMDGYALAGWLNALDLPGVRFREAWFTPSFSKYAGTRCGGCQVHVTDRRRFRPVATTLQVLRVVRERYAGFLEFHGDYFDRVTGTSRVREALQQGGDPGVVLREQRREVDQFASLRRSCLLYPE